MPSLGERLPLFDLISLLHIPPFYVVGGALVLCLISYTFFFSLKRSTYVNCIEFYDENALHSQQSVHQVQG